MEDGRRVFEAEFGRPGIDDLPAKSMQRVDRQFRGRTAELTANFVSETSRGFSGERDDQDARRIRAAVLHKVGDPGREHRGFSAAGTRNDAQRPVASGDRLLLCWREAFDHAIHLVAIRGSGQGQRRAEG